MIKAGEEERGELTRDPDGDFLTAALDEAGLLLPPALGPSC